MYEARTHSSTNNLITVAGVLAIHERKRQLAYYCPGNNGTCSAEYSFVRDTITKSAYFRRKRSFVHDINCEYDIDARKKDLKNTAAAKSGFVKITIFSKQFTYGKPRLTKNKVYKPIKEKKDTMSHYIQKYGPRYVRNICEIFKLYSQQEAARKIQVEKYPGVEVCLEEGSKLLQDITFDLRDHSDCKRLEKFKNELEDNSHLNIFILGEIQKAQKQDPNSDSTRFCFSQAKFISFSVKNEPPPPPPGLPVFMAATLKKNKGWLNFANPKIDIHEYWCLAD